MKLLRRLLICSVALAANSHADAAQWVHLTSERDLSYEVDMDSVKSGPDGYLEYVAKTLWKVPAMLSGATKPVAVSITRYQIDCDHKAWRAIDTNYVTAEGEPAGKAQPKDAAWTPIGPGTVVDLMFRKVC
ncbi:hypothetical protein C9I57_06110 [Trinickia symbiotica]|uniref:Surface-adhesin protein E-like domain-containing protein n=1 Tax=Trinickia symbiotica TaxID=863227 RepID=A0A2T3XXL2_9BURK|nr:surface-adhesin E family protein [Trinickia symbiotica]PTB21253.1 hypothetical protein C9I57_06110 [Trinickia symbiotica]